MTDERLIRGFVFACTQATEAQCLDRHLLATEKTYGPVVIRVRKGDLLYLLNIETDTMHGVFVATSDGDYKLDTSVFGLKYPYQVRVETLGGILKLQNAHRMLNKLGIKRNTPIYKEKLVDLLEAYAFLNESETSSIKLLVRDADNPIANKVKEIQRSRAAVDIEEEIPLIETTTFWDFPKQSYGLTPKGNNKYAGVTPALIIYNMVWRYTDVGELVVDPMCGSGTTLDVCKEERRRAIGYDIVSAREDIIQNDARSIPLDDNSVDMIFIDSPYGDNIKYNEHPDNIGNISCESEKFYDELEKVMIESYRILKDGKVLGWLIGDQWVQKVFTPVGFKVYERLCRHFEPVDLICVNRRGQYSNTGVWHNRARRFNFFLRGFKYLIIVRKVSEKRTEKKSRKIEWAYYVRGEIKGARRVANDY